MSPLYLGILGIAIVMLFTANGIPKAKVEAFKHGIAGVCTIAFASLLYAIFEQSSPLPLLLLKADAGMFEVFLVSAGYAFLLSGLLGLLRLGLKSAR